MLLAAQAHLGSKNMQVHMEPYLWKTRPDGVNVINIGKTWEKIVLAARIIVAIDNPADSTFPISPSQFLEYTRAFVYVCEDTAHRMNSLRHLCPPLRPACRPQVRCPHRRRRHRWSLHPG
jgi:hypothetical protein